MCGVTFVFEEVILAVHDLDTLMVERSDQSLQITEDIDELCVQSKINS